MPLTGYEPAVLGSERPLTYVLDRTASVIGVVENMKEYSYLIS
jgi:hypothetical protein